ncbi:hypothetical protein AYO37_01190 [Opitutia bacterium SCGC AG-212-L18]|nr:hypothetical protein AYO37_01190 [Opitutae bacterium SCGC AG-212-L18]
MPFEELSKLNCNTNYSIDLKDPHKSQVGFDRQKIKFAHPWSRDMTLDQLVENCFSEEKGLLSNINAWEYFIEGGSIMLNKQVLCSGYKTRTDRPNKDYLYTLGDKLWYLFSGQSYDISQLDAEFITNMTDTMLSRPAEDLVIIQPLLDYIEKYVKPAMDNYIANHPSKHRIDDSLKENDAQYAAQMAQVETLLVPAKAKSPQQSKVAILGMMMFGLSYLSWNLVNGLLREGY